MRFDLGIILLAGLTSIDAHKHPTTEHEREVQRALQAAAYHCAPAVESFTRFRKREFATRAVSGTPYTTFLDQQLFSPEAYADLATPGLPPRTVSRDDRELPPQEDDPDKTYMECMPVSETHIQNNTCVLAPEVTEGPYYHVGGHPIRQNIAEYQDGLPLFLDIGVIDVETCKPLPNVLIDIWQANATGIYAGHPVPYTHLKDEKPLTEGPRKGLLSPFPRTEPQERWLTGAWPTDRNGVAQFTTIYPGYYAGRATHIHAKVFTEWKLPAPSPSPPNHHSTAQPFFHASRLSHVGQFFFSEDLNDVVDKMYPYVTNPTRGRTLNLQDSLNIFNESHGPEGQYNPVFKTHLIGGVIRQGMVGFITMGVNTSASYKNI